MQPPVYLTLCRGNVRNTNIEETIIENRVVYLLFCLLVAQSFAFKPYFLCKYSAVDALLANSNIIIKSYV